MNESIFYILKNENEYRGEREQIFRFIEKGKKYDILFYYLFIYFCGGSNGIRKRDEDIEATRALKRYKIYK